MKEPFKSRTYAYIGKRLIPAYCQCFEFLNESEAIYFASSKRKEKETIKVDSFSINKGKKGNKRKEYFVCVFTPREEI